MPIAKMKEDSELKEMVYSFKYHPAILELKFCVLYDELYEFYGADMTDKVIFSLAKCFDCSESLLKALINNKHRIQLNKVYNVVQYRRTLLIMGLSWGYEKHYIAKHYFKNNFSSAYRGSYVSLSFLNDMWREQLKYTVCVLNTDEAIEELKNFLINVDALLRVFS